MSAETKTTLFAILVIAVFVGVHCAPVHGTYNVICSSQRSNMECDLINANGQKTSTLRIQIIPQFSQFVVKDPPVF